MASDVHKNTDTKVETVSANSVCRQLSQKTAEQGLAAAVAFAEEVQWSLAIRRTISGVGFVEALKLLMNTALGFLALWAVNATAAVTGVALGLNLLNALTVGVFGLPGFVLLLLAQWVL